MIIKQARLLGARVLVSETVTPSALNFQDSSLCAVLETLENNDAFQSLESSDAPFFQSPSSSLDVDCFLQKILSKPRAYLLAHGEVELSDEELNQFFNCLKKRRTGLPVAYITGQKEFYGYNFTVTKDVLIPKPDTEVLVELASIEIENAIKANPNSILTICDMCTGSGCIALSAMRNLLDNSKIPLAKLPKFTACDISQKALDVAKLNADNLLSGKERERIRFIRSNLFEAVPGVFDFVLTNPPYVPGKEARELLKDGRSEPLLALDGDVNEMGDTSYTSDGLALIRRLVPQVMEHLAPYGRVYIESGEYNADKTAFLLRKEGLSEVETYCDLSGMPRVTRGKKNSTLHF